MGFLRRSTAPDPVADDLTDVHTTTAQPAFIADALADQPGDLTAANVHTARFRTARHGYHYGDVDAFVATVAKTLTWLEGANQVLSAELDDARGLADDLQARNVALTHTIEIFRVRGDVIATDDGEVLTTDWKAHIAQLTARIAELEAQLGDSAVRT